MSKNIFPTLIIIIFWLLSFIVFSLPLEGGMACIIIGIIWLRVQLWRKSDYAISKIFILFVVLIVYIFIYRYYSKPIPITDLTFQRVLIYFMLTIFMYSSLQNDNDRNLWENALIVFAIVVSTISIIEVLLWYINYFDSIAYLQIIPKPQIVYRLKGNIFGHPNPLAGFLNFVWPIVFIRVYNSKESLQKYLWGILLFLFSVTFVYANSRGALLGAFSGAAIIFIAVMIDGDISLRKIVSLAPKNKKQMGLALGAMVIIAVSVLGRSIFTGQFHNRSFSGRGTIWEYSWDAFLENPLFGQGIGAFPISYTRLAQLPPGNFVHSAHNLWLQLSVDYGIIGLIFVCVLISVFLFYSVKAMREKSTHGLSYKFAYIAGGIAFLAQQTVEYMLGISTYLIISLVFLVLITKHVLLLGEWGFNKKTFSLFGIGILGMIAIFQLVVSYNVMSFSDYLAQRDLAENNEWVHLEKQICLNAKKYPNNALYKFECSNVIVKQIIQLEQNNAVKHDDTLIDKAIYYQQAGNELNPYWAIQEANLSILYWEKGDYVRAISLMENAVKSVPDSDLLLLNLGWMEEEVGNQETAIDYYSRALRLNPLINLSEFSQNSSLFNTASQNLVVWGQAEDLWDSWYDNARYDRGSGSRDHEYWKGVIALSTRQYASAIQYFQNSIDSGNMSSSLYSYLAYSYKMNEQPGMANTIAKDLVLLANNNVRGIGGPVELSIVASILLESGENELAYDLLLNAFWKAKSETHQKYYTAIYSQGFIISDISPWMIRNQIVISDIKQDWDWVTEEVLRRGDVLLAKSISEWQVELSGIAKP